MNIFAELASDENVDPALRRVLNLTDAKRKHDRFNPAFEHSAFTHERRQEIGADELVDQRADERREELGLGEYGA